MSTGTGIEWTDATWNPVAGCNDVSEGCRHCYARGMASRLEAMGQIKYTGLTVLQGSKTVWTGRISFDEKMLLDPLRWKKPRRIFVNSMSDLFHENVTDEMRDRIFAVMALCPQHTFQVLTKRPERMLAYVTPTMSNYQPANIFDAADRILEGESLRSFARRDHRFIDRRIPWPLPNVQLGVSVENQKAADERIPLLLQTPAAVRFISAEPLLGAVDAFLTGQPALEHVNGVIRGRRKLDWVICGGESGAGARPMHPDWARSLRDQCVAAGVPFFFKQWGEWTPGENVERAAGIVDTATWFNDKWSFDRENLANDEGHVDDEPDLYRVGKHAAGALLDGREWREFPGVKP